jgi:aerobic-type carbon monoxide dehydrogenase small subunit (CoxS/CutS family)
MSIATRPLSLTINGRRVGPMDVPEELMMLDFLSEHLGLTGTRLGCGLGICRACTVILDRPDGSSEEIQACISSAHDFAGKSVRTIEGHAERDANHNVVRLSPVQQAFVEHFSFQCGYCTPGFVNAATVLMENLRRSPVVRKDLEKKIEAALDGHICRCTGYIRYYQAIRDLILRSPGLVQA